MSEIPQVEPGDWITVNSRVDAVVCTVYEKRDFADIEVVYLDDRDRAINEDVVWDKDHWKFKFDGPSGGYADKHGRLSDNVAILRKGRY